MRAHSYSFPEEKSTQSTVLVKHVRVDDKYSFLEGVGQVLLTLKVHLSSFSESFYLIYYVFIAGLSFLEYSLDVYMQGLPCLYLSPSSYLLNIC